MGTVGSRAALVPQLSWEPPHKQPQAYTLQLYYCVFWGGRFLSSRPSPSHGDPLCVSLPPRLAQRPVGDQVFDLDNSRQEDVAAKLAMLAQETFSNDSQPDSQPASHSPTQPASQPANQQVIQPTSKPARQPASQLGRHALNELTAPAHREGETRISRSPPLQ